MEQQKKILLALPASLVQELDHIAIQCERSRSSVIRSAIESFVVETKRQDLTEQMKSGYREMGELNLQLAENALFLDSQQQISYEETLSECEDI